MSGPGRHYMFRVWLEISMSTMSWFLFLKSFAIKIQNLSRGGLFVAPPDKVY